MSKLQNFIDGSFVDPIDGRYIENVNPVNGTTISMIPESSAADIDRAVIAANQSLTRPDWDATYVTPKARGQWLSRIADGIADRLELFAQAESLDTGTGC